HDQLAKCQREVDTSNQLKFNNLSIKVGESSKLDMRHYCTALARLVPTARVNATQILLGCRRCGWSPTFTLCRSKVPTKNLCALPYCRQKRDWAQQPRIQP